METLEYPDPIPVIPRRFDNQSDSLPKYLVEAVNLSPVAGSPVEGHGRWRMHAIVTDFGTPSRVSDPIITYPLCSGNTVTN
ncbi:hypothetical protein GALMADRAFT_227506 [Galerina marginata CBS 339.88]|uniref:Uncharacterized protein n=1 Tax=Galerina marginata (strain CBS 339.88) TaxID=685588 RepID=A0A067SUC2_GALM3|nr:hypothetical protein GALMADRAFT_227506 [Galerina marginata CBS 339.88]